MGAEDNACSNLVRVAVSTEQVKSIKWQEKFCFTEKREGCDANQAI